MARTAIRNARKEVAPLVDEVLKAIDERGLTLNSRQRKKAFISVIIYRLGHWLGTKAQMEHRAKLNRARMLCQLLEDELEAVRDFRPIYDRLHTIGKLLGPADEVEFERVSWSRENYIAESSKPFDQWQTEQPSPVYEEA